MASEPPFKPLTGRCTCGALTYTIHAPPLITHCCHCTWCQRETGTVCVLNARIESSNFTYRIDPKSALTTPSPNPPSSIDTTTALLTPIPTSSGDPQIVARCPLCLTAVFSHYGADTSMTAVKAGTLNDDCRSRVRPDVHIYLSSKVEWVDLSKEVERGVPMFDEYYDAKEVWTAEALKRLEVKKAAEAGKQVKSSG